MMIPLSKPTYRTVPEGKNVFLIESVEYNADFGRLIIQLKTADNIGLRQSFDLNNDIGRNVFSSFARAAFKDRDLEEVDADALKGRYIAFDVEYREFQDNEGNTRRYAQKRKNTYWEEVAEEEEFTLSEEEDW